MVTLEKIMKFVVLLPIAWIVLIYKTGAKHATLSPRSHVIKHYFIFSREKLLPTFNPGVEAKFSKIHDCISVLMKENCRK